MNLEYIVSSPEFLQFTLEDRVKFCMFCYGRGVDAASEALYGAMLEHLPEDSPVRFLEWEDIEIQDIQHILDALNVSADALEGLNKEAVGEEYYKENYLYLQKKWGRNKSITMIDTMEEAQVIVNKMYPYVTEEKEPRGKGYVASLKYDGWNITAYYIPGESKPVLIHTRARTGKAIYCTSVLRDYFPEIETDTTFRVVGELCLDEDALKILREYYSNGDRDFVNTRNSVSSVVHGTIDLSLIKDYIKYYAFALQTEEGNVEDTYTETLASLQELGFDTPYCTTFTTPTALPKAMEHLTNYYKVLEQHIQCDGVVVELDDFRLQKQCVDFVAGDNQAGLMAVKADYWSKKVYEGVVIDIDIPLAEQNRTVEAIIEPVRTSSGSTVRKVPLINLKTASKFEDRYVDVGDTILFTYHSQQIVHFEGFKEVLV